MRPLSGRYLIVGKSFYYGSAGQDGVAAIWAPKGTGGHRRITRNSRGLVPPGEVFWHLLKDPKTLSNARPARNWGSRAARGSMAQIEPKRLSPRPPKRPTVSSLAHVPAASFERHHGQRRCAGQTSREKTSCLGTELWLRQRSIEVPLAAWGSREARDLWEAWQAIRQSARFGHYRKSPWPRQRYTEQSKEVPGRLSGAYHAAFLN